ncbi:MAG: hypothetical protein IIW40_00285, partial [Clostridia bacterium]|nr:hypothetical protein [Clostridia bacterium]
MSNKQKKSAVVNVFAAYSRRLLLLWIDLLITTVSFFVSWLCFNEIYMQNALLSHWGVLLPLTLLFTGAALLLLGCYDSLLRYQESREYMMQFFALACAHGALFVFGHFLLTPVKMEYPQRFQVLVMLTSLVAMWMSRFVYRYLRQAKKLHRHRQVATVNVAIVGAGDAGVSLVDEMRRDPECPYKVVCFFDDDPVKQRAHVRGLPVRGSLDTIADHLKDSDVSEIIVAIPSLDDERTREVLQQCSMTSCRVRILPSIFSQLPSEDGNLMSNV